MKKYLLATALLASLPLHSMAQDAAAKFSIGQCYREMWADARAKPVADRVGIGQNPIPLALRSSKAKANPKERESLEFIATAMQACQAQDQPNRAGYHPLTKQMVDAYEAGYRDVLTRTYSGDLTWGASIAANEANSDAFDKRNAELTAIGEAQRAQQAQAEKQAEEARKMAAEAEYQRRAALRADFERQQAAEARRQQAENERQAAQDITNGLLLMQAARPRPAAPILTPQVYCSTQVLGGIAHTNCR